MEKTFGSARATVPLGALLGFLLLWACPNAFALNPALDVSQYAHTTWKIRDGFSKGQITSIAQTPDGYLWIGTDAGLLRFDGIKAIPWQPPGGQHLPSNSIVSLLAARDGTLWIGTSKGLASWKDTRINYYPELADQYIFKLLEDHEGTVWVGGGAIPSGKLCSIQAGDVKLYGENGTLGRGVIGLYEDSKGAIWVGVEAGLWRWRPGPPKFYSLPGESDGIRALGEDSDGALLVGYKGAIQRFVDGELQRYSLPDSAGQFRAKHLYRDRDGSLWIASQDRGLLHLHQGKTDVFTLAEGLSGESVHAIIEDREGNIWAATVNGLDRFREFAVTTISVNQGLLSTIVGSVLASKDGSVWIGTFGGLHRWNNGHITVFGRGAGRQSGTLNGSNPNSLFEDKRGRIWISTLGGVGYLEGDRFISLRGIPSGAILGIVEDAEESLWFASENAGLVHLAPGGAIKQIPWTALGHKDHASAVIADPLKGGLWIGFHLGGVAYLADGQIRATYTSAEGLSEGRVNHLRLEQDGTLWIATDNGISRLKNGRIATITSRNGLPCDAFHWSIADDTHSLWLKMTCGLIRVAPPDLDDWIAAVDADKDAKPAIRVTVFNNLDGARLISAGTHYSPSVAKASDGKIWFASLDGVSVLDPSRLSINQLQPPVHVERVTADRKTYDAIDAINGRLQLPMLIRDLQIDYTGLSLVAPEKVLFRYKLEGHDVDWQDVGDRRSAFYNDLPPGDYHFRVMACNNSGVWNETGSYLDFYIPPAYYQTSWFRASSVAAFLVLLGVLYQLRLRQVARQVRGRMEERIEERERIARDLHDTLLQSVQGLILKFHAVSKQIPREAPAHDALEKTLDYADEVLAEGRDRVRNLRGHTDSLTDLPAAFQRIVRETPQGRQATFKTVVEGDVRDLHPMILEESYSIGREAIINALAHSEGFHVEVEITYDRRQFRLRVRDDGRGFDPEILEQGGRPDHWGLQGMRERAQRIGAQLKLWSRPATGTEVELIVPGATAYQSLRPKSRRSWFRRSPSIDSEQL